LITQGSGEKGCWDEAFNYQKLLSPLIQKNPRFVDFCSCCRTLSFNQNVSLLR